MEALRVIDSGKKTALENMSLDLKLLNDLKADGAPILHLYGWQRPSLTYGYFISLDKHLKMSLLGEKKIDFAKRPTGGGIVFHFWDLAFSFLMPSGHRYFYADPLENYYFVNRQAFNALSFFLAGLKKPLPAYRQNWERQNPPALAFCMAGASKYDLLIAGKKALGAAQRKKKQGYLHQGTISLAKPEQKLLLELLLEKQTALAIFEKSFFCLENTVDLDKARVDLQNFLIESFTQALGA